MSTSIPPPSQPVESTPSESSDPEKNPQPAAATPPAAPPAYTAFTTGRKRFILLTVTIAGFFGPLAGNIYLPALPVLTREFHVSITAINATVSVFMLVFAFGVSILFHQT